MSLRGTVNWTGFGPKGEDWLGFLFRIEAFEGTVPERNDEGTLEWHPVDRILDLPMWEGDRLFLPLVFDDDPRPFHAYMPYDGDRPRDWTWVRL
jgi:8-oxo-dGTP diphosphatase